MKTVTFAIASLTLALAGAAIAQTPAQNPAVNPGSTKVDPTHFSSLDTNKDGRVSKDEVKAHAEITSSFAALDTDRDTYLSESEFGKWKPASHPDASKASPGSGSSPAPGSR